MRRVVWSNDALDDLDSMIEHLAEEGANANNIILDRIESAINLLAEVPAGRIGRVAGTHEWHVRRTPYIVAYSVTNSSLNIVRVIHGARDWPDDTWPASI